MFLHRTHHSKDRITVTPAVDGFSAGVMINGQRSVGVYIYSVCSSVTHTHARYTSWRWWSADDLSNSHVPGVCEDCGVQTWHRAAKIFSRCSRLFVLGAPAVAYTCIDSHQVGLNDRCLCRWTRADMMEAGALAKHLVTIVCHISRVSWPMALQSIAIYYITIFYRASLCYRTKRKTEYFVLIIWVCCRSLACTAWVPARRITDRHWRTWEAIIESRTVISLTDQCKHPGDYAKSHLLPVHERLSKSYSAPIKVNRVL